MSAPAGHCDPACRGWFPSTDDRDGIERIERCDECARASGRLDSYDDDDAEHDAAAWFIGAVRRGFVHPRKPDDPGRVFDALWATESGRVALAGALRGAMGRGVPPG